MIVAFKGAFHRDASKIKDRHVRNAALEIIQIVKDASSISQIQRLIKLREYKVHYRI